VEKRARKERYRVRDISERAIVRESKREKRERE
jgi:hypothetical protein